MITLITLITNPFSNIATAQTVTDYEGNVYNTVDIGTQTWMKENLRSKKYSDGTDIDTTLINACNDDPSTVSALGYLYTWPALMNGATTEGSKGACPNGWHVPTVTEYSTLITYLGGSGVAGKKMKSTDTAYWDNIAFNDDASGFSAQGGGYKLNYLYFYYKAQAKFWTSTEDGNNAREIQIQSDGPNLYNLYGSSKTIVRSSCRCLSNNPANIGDTKAKIKVNIYPNPTTENITIEWNSNSTANLQIINSMGGVISEQQISKTTNISIKNKGIYFVKITDDSNSVVKIIVVE